MMMGQAIAVGGRRFFVPEVVQTSAMDCGPASLKAILEGYGISASYGRLREACQTEVDGTSIDTLEEVAGQLGLNAEQVMLPADHLLIDEAAALPAIVVIRLPSGLTHFVVAWRRHGGWVQVMDPGTGRQWVSRKRFLESLFIHRFPVPASGWREWAGSDDFLLPLHQRLLALRLAETDARRLRERALADPGWRPLAALDAATRLVTSLVNAGGIDRGKDAQGVVERFFLQEAEERPEPPGTIPPPYWSVYPQPRDTDDGEETLILRGAVLVRVTGRRPARPARPLPAEPPTAEPPAGAAPTVELEGEEVEPLSPELAAVLEEPPDRPELAVFRALKEDGLLTPAVLAVALALASIGTIVQAVLLQGIMQLGQNLGLMELRLTALVAVILFVGLLFVLELPISGTIFRAGRHLEMRLRIAFLMKIPRLSDRYFHSRLTSDMTERAYDLRQLRQLPTLGVTILRQCFQLTLTTAGLIWLKPDAAPIALAATAAFIGLSFATNPLLQERDLRLRTHSAALSRFYLDALLGLIPLRTHGAERPFRREHENVLVEWVHASIDFARLALMVQVMGSVVYSGFAVWLVSGFAARGGDAGGLLLLLYWTLNLPALGQSLTQTIQQYPAVRNMVLRLLEPLGTPDEVEEQEDGEDDESVAAAEAPRGVAVELRGVTVRAGGHEILKEIDLAIGAGTHVAVVGPSGAGKSSLVGILLGWHRPAAGVCLVDGEPLSGKRLRALRRQTAWVDPAVQIWNRSLLENLLYGNQAADAPANALAVEQADLFEVLERLPNGLQTSLGEGGGLVSGGQGQRVRLGRAMNRAGVRLVILDEPFRGLDRAKRRDLLERARVYWREATLICITHDVGETRGFQRVIVIGGGRIIEDARPSALARRRRSRYRALLEAEEAVRVGLWQSAEWRRLWIESGRLMDKPPAT
ncbi:MAG: ATP-binding cassette domain-containing protein [Chloroflexi bacterium]|nr:ATP-binding cassette domain-containing protein [Chloroflexota bacterium]